MESTLHIGGVDNLPLAPSDNAGAKMLKAE
jgi:hypothetical protein